MEFPVTDKRNCTAIKPVGCLCDFTGSSDIPVINNSRPLFSWGVDGSGRDAFQVACRIIVAQEPNDNSEVWDSGRISRTINHLKYNGQDFSPESVYFWKVKLWDNSGAGSKYSPWRMFRTGSFKPGDNLKISQSMVLQNRIYPKIMQKTSDDIYFIDFGKDAFSGLELMLSAELHDEVELRLGEELAPDGTIYEPESKSQACGRRFRKIILELEPGNKIYKIDIPKPYMGDGYQTGYYNNREDKCIFCPDHTGELMPFRYLEIRGYENELKNTDVAQLAANYPFDDSAAYFHCSEPGLNDVWDFCKYTIKATTPFAVYIDGDRERLPYAGDTYINQLSHYCCDKEYSITRNTLDYFFEVGADWPFEAVMSIILIARSDYYYTGDISFCEKYYEKLKEMLFNELARNDGLLVTGEISGDHPVLNKIKSRLSYFRDLIDWPKIFRDNYDAGQVNTIANCFYYRALNAFAEIAFDLGCHNDYREYKQRANILKNAVRKTLFNPESGLFIDSEGSINSSIQANYHAVAAGLAKDCKLNNIVKLLKSKGMQCGLWGAQFLLEALFQSGAEDFAIKLMTSEGPRSWLNMLKQGATMTMECWSNELQPEQDWNHAWSTSPLNIIARFLMGIRPLAPGFRKILIQPQSGFVKNASLKLPTVSGEIYAGFKQNSSNYELKIKIPGNCSATVILPEKHRNKRCTELTINSRKKSFFTSDGYITIDNLCPGSYHIILHLESENVKVMGCL